MNKIKKIYSIFMDKLNIVKTEVLSNLINAIPIEISVGYFVDIDNKILKNMNKVGSLMSPYFKTYYKARWCDVDERIDK